MYIVQHFDELQLSQEKMDVTKYAKLSVPAVNQSIRSITIKYSQANPGLGRFTARGPSFLLLSLLLHYPRLFLRAHSPRGGRQQRTRPAFA